MSAAMRNAASRCDSAGRAVGVAGVVAAAGAAPFPGVTPISFAAGFVGEATGAFAGAGCAATRGVKPRTVTSSSRITFRSASSTGGKYVAFTTLGFSPRMIAFEYAATAFAAVGS